MIPPGAKTAFAESADCNDHARIWDALDKVLAKHPDIVLLHGGTAKVAPFKRNDQLLQTLPIGVIVFPGSGITGNLADKARILGIPVWRFDGGGG